MYYYLMNTEQFEAVPEYFLNSSPLTSVSGDFHIVEAVMDGLDAELEFEDEDDCAELVSSNEQYWDIDWDLSH